MKIKRIGVQEVDFDKYHEYREEEVEALREYLKEEYEYSDPESIEINSLDEWIEMTNMVYGIPDELEPAINYEYLLNREVDEGTCIVFRVNNTVYLVFDG